jgi:hypothetical protein
MPSTESERGNPAAFPIGAASLNPARFDAAVVSLGSNRLGRSPVSGWTKRRWFDLRNGYGLYVSIFLGFVNFCILISVKFPGLNPYVFIPLIGVGAVASATGIGYLHRKNQLRIDQDSTFEQSRLLARVYEIQLKATLGKATDEEIAWALNLLAKIRTGQT